MARTTSMNHKALPERLTMARQECNMTQKQAADALVNYYDGKKSYTAAYISLLENGRRTASIYTTKILAEIYGCTPEYLQGITKNPAKSEPDNENLTEERPVMNIPYGLLKNFDGQPVYVEFLDLSHEPGWALYDRKTDSILFLNKRIILSNRLAENMAFYIFSPEYAQSFNRFTTKSITLNRLLSEQQVYVILNTVDPIIRARYEGWYHHNENKTNLINSVGLTLPYEGLNLTYFAFSNRIAGE